MLRHDLRFALRLHARRPRLAGLIILTLGLAIGATTSLGIAAGLLIAY